ncbi:SAVED domain-containing protein [Pectobacterium brasiliense]|uniref:SAVED domain-containing protein n=1 Tax=Pectobacterium brasiliense TaxID=180957 RepID=UPI001968F8EE|nr:SAVED domain-containing protein [Pectobacterium brasiliense]QSD21932.1 SAVED domain-containing protein [Pectobacterium brasiliense]
MTKATILYVLKLIFRPKDLLTRLALGMFKCGMTGLLGGWGLKLVFSEDVLKKYINIFDGVSISYQKCTDIALIFGGVATFLALVLWCYCVFLAVRDLNKRDIALVCAYGFEGIDPRAAEKMLSARERTKILPVDFKAFDSRNKNEILENSVFHRRIIKDRVYHSEATQAYVAALGSVPYLYMIGSFMRDGHLPLKLFDFDRSKNCFHPLDDVPTGAKLVKKFDGKKVESSSVVKPNENGRIALAISFTMEIQNSELPAEFYGHALHTQLNTGFRFDNLPAEDEQAEIAKELSFIISELKKSAEEVHLFVSAQASLVFRLGSLYQEGLHGVINIWSWNSSLNTYDWNLSIDSKSVN